jgi:membrane-bound metal-dependent hydrolase YbcI (DUF457 family)
VLAGIERVRIVPGVTASNPLDLYYMPYTHSLVAALVWSAVAFAVYALASERRHAAAALIVAAAVFSHWILDLVVHRPDLPLYDNAAKVGLGLWNFPAAAFGLEAFVLFGGMALAIRVKAVRPVPSGVFGIGMLAIQAYVFFGPPPASDKAAAVTALISYIVFAVIIRWIEGGPRARLTAAGALP